MSSTELWGSCKHWSFLNVFIFFFPKQVLSWIEEVLSYFWLKEQSDFHIKVTNTASDN